RQKWSCVDPSVWTDRMLTALETGSKETSCEQQSLYSLVGTQGLFRQSRTEKPSIGEQDAGKPPVRFGGRGGAIQCAVPTSIEPRADRGPWFGVPRLRGRRRG